MSFLFNGCGCGDAPAPKEKESKGGYTVCTVFGATGAQGGSVARALAASKRFNELRLTTRDVNKEAAVKLAQECVKYGNVVKLVKCDLAHQGEVELALDGATHSFLVTNWWESFIANGAVPGKEGFEAGKRAGEIEFMHGRHWVDACAKFKLQFCVFSGLENVSKLTKGKIHNVYHFDYKGQIEEYMWKHLPGRAASVRVSMYMENFLTMMRPNSDGSLALPSGVEPLGLVSVAELGGVVDGIFKEGPSKWADKALGVSGDNLTGAEIAAAWSKAIGKTVTYVDVPADVYATFGFPGDAELAEMFQFYRDAKLCVREPAETRRVSTGKVSSFSEFCEAHKEKLAF